MRSIGDECVGLWVRRCRTRRGLSQEALAGLVGRSQRWMVDVENGRTEPRFSDMRRLAEVLEADATELLTSSCSRAGSVEAPRRMAVEEDEDTKRRELFGWLAAVAGAGLLDVERLAALAGRPASVDATYLRDAEAVTRGLAEQWYTARPAVLLPAATGHLNALTASLPSSGPLSRPLASLTGRTARLVELLLRAQGQTGEAYRYNALAEVLAREAGDETLRARVLNGRSHLYFRSGDLGRALAAQDEALALDGPGMHRANSHASRAEKRATAGDSRGALRDLDAADSGLSGAVDWFYFGPRDAVELGAFRGSVEMLTGRNGEAVRTLGWVLERMDPALVSWRAAVLADLGAALAHQQQVEDACARLTEALALAREAGVLSHRRRVEDVRRRDLAEWATVPAVRQLDEQLALSA